MEPDLDRLLDFESHGGLFPQFGEVWDDAFTAAKMVTDDAGASSPGRKRIALNISYPLSFTSLFLVLAREKVDLFLFNPNWGNQEMNTARETSDCEIEIRDHAPGQFSFQKHTATRKGQTVQMGRNLLRVMIPTGGSSGRIRFAIHDWSTLAAAVYGFQQHMACDRMAGHCVLPLYHVSGFMQLIRALLTMGSVVFGRLESFAEEFALLEKEPIKNRFLSLVATQLERMIRGGVEASRLQSYAAIFIGGGPVPIGLLDAARELQLPLAPTYGMTETAAQIATLQPESFLSGQTSQGKSLPHVRIEIVDESDTSRPLHRKEVGLVKVYARSLFRGYYGEEPAGELASFLTTDLGFIDRLGQLTIMGRADRVMITGGEKVNPREVEMVFEKSGLVKDVMCFAREDKEWGQVLCVAYVPQDVAVSELALREVVSRELSSFKVPKIWVRLEVIPRNEAGKVDLGDLENKVGI